MRPFTLLRDRLYWRKALDALDRLTGLDDRGLRLSSEHFRKEWKQATDRTPRERAFRSGYQIGEEGEGGQGKHTDIELAYAWLYQDVAHGDEASTGYFGVEERYNAAVGVFSHIAVVAIETLHYINELVAVDVVDLPVGTFSDPVVVTATEHISEGWLYATEVGRDLRDVEIPAEMPEGLRPAFELARELMANPAPQIDDMVGVEMFRTAAADQLLGERTG